MFNNNEKKDKQLDNLINLVENHTRTKRHLEQYSHIGRKENKENARDKQKVREEQINTLKNHIIGNNSDKLSIEEQVENITDNFQKTNEYLNNNYKNMSQNDINNMAEKQRHRLEQLSNLSEKSDKKDELF